LVIEFTMGGLESSPFFMLLSEMVEGDVPEDRPESQVAMGLAS